MRDEAWLPQFDPDRCRGCGACVALCPTGALEMRQARAWLARPELCSYCAVCETACPSGAIALPYLVVFADSWRSDR